MPEIQSISVTYLLDKGIIHLWTELSNPLAGTKKEDMIHFTTTSPPSFCGKLN